MSTPGPAPLADEVDLAPLRDELQIVPGPAALDGAPSWMIVDPVRGAFFQIGPQEMAWLGLWSEGKVAALRRAFREHHHREPAGGTLERLYRFLTVNRLLRITGPEALAGLHDEHRAGRSGPLQWLLHHYLFVRVPLVRPDRWLQGLTRRLAWLFTWPAALALLATAVLGLYLIGRQWEQFWQTLPGFFTIEGLAVYGLGLVLCKTLHELGHAVMATRFGCRVTTMGVAWVVMMPMLYTDTTDVWRLRSRRARVWVDSAGVLAELALAAVASVLWVFLPDGPVRSMCFVLATTSWVMTLSINLSPFMRFDGYFLLSDALRMPNLHARAQAIGRWWLRRTFLGLDAPVPEALSPRRRRGLVAFAVATWLYRVVLFAGIALAVYHFFFKALGVLLFVVEIGWFIVRPVMSELKVWREQWPAIRRQPRALLSGVVLIALLGLMALPLDRHVAVPAILGAKAEEAVHAPEAARVEARLVAEGQSVRAGEVMFRLASPELDQQEREGRIRLRVLQARLDRSAADHEDLARRLELQEAVSAEQMALVNIARRRTLLEVAAPFSGRVYELDPALVPGRWVNPREPLLRIVDEGQGLDLRGWVEAASVWRVEPGAQGRFVPDDASRPSVPVRVTHVAAIAAERLDTDYLSSDHGGPISVAPGSNGSGGGAAGGGASGSLAGSESEARVPVQAHYPVRLEPLSDDGSAGQVIRGRALVAARGESLLQAAFRQVTAVLARESGL